MSASPARALSPSEPRALPCDEAAVPRVPPSAPSSCASRLEPPRFAAAGLAVRLSAGTEPAGAGIAGSTTVSAPPGEVGPPARSFLAARRADLREMTPRGDSPDPAVLARGGDPPEPPAELTRGDDPPEPPAELTRGDDPPEPPAELTRGDDPP